MLKVTNLVKYYRRFLALDGVSFEVNDGEIVGLLGPNGAGKTTVLRCITGIIQYNEGRVEVEELNLKDNEEDLKRRLAFVPEVPSPYEMMTVREHLKFIAMAYQTMDDFDKRCDKLLEQFDLSDKQDDLVLSLSKGMKQKLAIACAFIHDAQVLLFDEPLIGIDPKGAKQLKDLINQAKKAGKAILISTHMLDTAEHLCDRIIILQSGKIIAEGDMQNLSKRAHKNVDASLEDVFLSLTQEQSGIENTDLS